MSEAMTRAKLSVLINDNGKKLYKMRDALETLRDSCLDCGLDRIAEKLDSFALVAEGVADDLIGADCDELYEAQQFRDKERLELGYSPITKDSFRHD